jgi:DNA replication and repair protein RecF
VWLTEIEADRLRNLVAVRILLNPGLTVLVGRNGQGKTSILEAAYLLATGRSFRTRRLDDLIARSGGPLRAAGMVRQRHGTTTIRVLAEIGERSLLVDGLEVEIENLLGRLDIVALTAERMGVLRAGPEERRRFLDRGVIGLFPGFLHALGTYRKLLLQRNALLRAARAERRRPAEDELAAWDERLVAAGMVVHQERRRYAVELGSRLGEAARVLFPSHDALVLRYRPSPTEAADIDVSGFASVFASALIAGRARDLALGQTCRGPHRDDLVVELDGNDLRHAGSAGQVRSAMVGLKLGKLSLLRERRREAPVFLMDDFDSDLDDVRVQALAEHLSGEGIQAIVATSKASLVDRLGVSSKKVVVEDGRARPA